MTVNGKKYDEKECSICLDLPMCIEDSGGGCDTMIIDLSSNKWSTKQTTPCQYSQQELNYDDTQMSTTALPTTQLPTTQLPTTTPSIDTTSTSTQLPTTTITPTTSTTSTTVTLTEIPITTNSPTISTTNKLTMTPIEMVTTDPTQSSTNRLTEEPTNLASSTVFGTNTAVDSIQTNTESDIEITNALAAQKINKDDSDNGALVG
eukprot:510324_1